MSRIVAIDTSTEACSAALLVDGVVSFCEEVAPQAHTRKILPMCETLLNDASLSLSDLDALAFGRGPGSFTGVRIGIGVAQGLALGASLPLIGISNLATLAQGAYRRDGAQRVLCAIDARMNEVYFAAFTLKAGVMAPLGEEAVLSPEEACSRAMALIAEEPGAWFAAGTGFAAYQHAFVTLQERVTIATEALPWAQDMLVLAEQALQSGETCDVDQAIPVYLRDKVTWKKLPGRE
jgi:universal bacterial protein YeaZ